MSARPPQDEPPSGSDGWPDESDAWDASDREWRQKWDPSPPEHDKTVPPPPGYRSQKTSIRSVADSYEEGMREAGPYLTIGLQIAFSMLFFVGAGWALDEWAGTSPWGILVGSVLGFTGVIGLVFKLAAQANTPKK